MTDAGKPLLIPIRVRAFLKGDEDNTEREKTNNIYAKLFYDFSRLNDFSGSLEDALFQSGSCPAGAHIHWSLPKCFSHGIQDESSGVVTYRLAPNRWSVTRLWSQGGGRPLEAKTFVVESDVLTRLPCAENAGSSTWPYTADTDQPYRYIGRFAEADGETPFSNESKSGAEWTRLTAVSPATPFFAAYYPACRNVFGLYDDLKGVEYAELCYLVCGWYEKNDEDEPFTAIHKQSELLEQFGLTIDEQGEWPSRTLCHGLTDRLSWQTKRTHYYSGLPDDYEPGTTVDTPRLAFGNTSAEAHSALKNNSQNVPAAGERLLCYYLSNMENLLIGRGGIADAEQALHTAAFSSQKPPDLPIIKCSKEDAPPPDYTCMEKLSGLRQRCRERYGLIMRLLQDQREIYELCYICLYCDEEYKSHYMSLLQHKAQETLVEADNLKVLSEKLDKDISSFCPGDGYELALEPDEPFWTPNDPVLLISQLANEPRDTGDSPLKCRRIEDVVTAVSIGALTGNPELRAASLSPALNLPPEMPGEIAALVGEAILLSGSFSEYLARQAFLQARIEFNDGELKALAKKIAMAQDRDGSIDNITFTGVLPESVALTRHTAEWYPLILEWSADYRPDMAAQSEHPTLGNWLLEGDDLTINGDINITCEYTVQGRLFISNNANRQALWTARRLSNDFPVDSPRIESLLSQSLIGFNDFLLSRAAELTSALYDMLLRSDDGIKELVESLDPSVLNGAPLFDIIYSPIRAGLLSFIKVRIIDALGRYQDIPKPSVYLSETLRPPGA